MARVRAAWFLVGTVVVDAHGRQAFPEATPPDLAAATANGALEYLLSRLKDSPRDPDAVLAVSAAMSLGLFRDLLWTSAAGLAKPDERAVAGILDSWTARFKGDDPFAEARICKPLRAHLEGLRQDARAARELYRERMRVEDLMTGFFRAVNAEDVAALKALLADEQAVRAYARPGSLRQAAAQTEDAQEVRYVAFRPMLARDGRVRVEVHVTVVGKDGSSRAGTFIASLVRTEQGWRVGAR